MFNSVVLTVNLRTFPVVQILFENMHSSIYKLADPVVPVENNCT